MIPFIEKRKYSFIFSGVLFAVSIALLAIYGLKPGIDFTGGSLLEVRFTENRPSVELVRGSLEKLDVGLASVQPANENGFLIKLKFLSEEEHQTILSTLRSQFETKGTGGATTTQAVVTSTPTTVQAVGQNGKPVTVQIEQVTPNDVDKPVVGGNRMEEVQLQTIGPAISSTLKASAARAAAMVLVAIILFVAYAFRRVSKPVASWKYGVVAVVALIHDVVITMGIFALLGHFWSIEVDVLFVVALLTILGYSVNDTIVIFDRIREKIIRSGSDKFPETVNRGLNETVVRSINTSLATFLVMAALFFFGGESIKYFALTLMFGIFFGTYSSIFVASPLLVEIEHWGNPSSPKATKDKPRK